MEKLIPVALYRMTGMAVAEPTDMAASSPRHICVTVLTWV